ncbi:MAG: hypothetical protein Q8S57_09555 [Methanoregula sp.]|nr:hypothetical protein [Methanoregula sp.]
MDKRWWILLLVCAILAAGVLLYAFNGEEQGDFTKVLVIKLHIGQNGVREDLVSLRYGHPPEIGLRSGSFSGRLLSADGKTVKEFAIWDPRIQLGDMVIDDGHGGEMLSGAKVQSPEADLLLTLPYTGVEERFELHDRSSGRLIKSVNLSSAITSFSQTYPSDPDGPRIVSAQQGLPLITMIAGGAIFFLLVLVVLMMVRKR